MTYRLIFTFLFTFNSFLSFSQNYKFGKVSLKDFEVTSAASEGDVDAFIIYREESLRFPYVSGKGFVQKRYVYERIKINTEKGFEYATKRVRLYDRNNKTEENMVDLKAYTYNIVNGEIERTKLKKDGIFHEERNEYWKVKSFTMPNVQEGSVIEFRYQINSPFMTIDDVILQYNIPINKLKVKLNLPEYYTYNTHFNLRAAYQPHFEYETETEDISLTYESSSQRHTMQNKIIRLEDDFIPALKSEPMISSIENYRAKMIIELSAINFPDEIPKNYSNTWSQVSKDIFDDAKFGRQINKHSFFKEDLNAHIRQSDKGLGQISQILAFVKRKVKWNNYYGKFTQKGIKKAYQEGSGNVADINLLLIAMLRESGYNAYPVLVSTKSNGVPVYPTQEGFNYVIAQVTQGDDEILLDATDDLTTLNVLPRRVLNWQGRLIKEDGLSNWVDLTPQLDHKNSTMISSKVTDDLALESSVKKRHEGYSAYQYRDNFKKSQVNDIIKHLENNNDLDVLDFDIENLDNLNESIDLSYKVLDHNSIEQIGDNLYITPLAHESLKENPFKLDNRALPVDLVYPIKESIIINLEIPESYQVESIPESVKVLYNEGAASYIMMVKKIDKTIKIIAKFISDDIVVHPNDYTNWKQFYSTIMDKQQEKIVLKKI